MESAGLADEQDSDAGPALLTVLNKLGVTILRFDLIPELCDLAICFRGMFRDAVEGNHATLANHRAVSFEVLFDALVPMVAVDKQKVQRPPVKHLAQPPAHPE